MIRTSDRGGIWTNATTATNPVYDIFFADDSMGWVVGDLGEINRTGDSAATFVTQTSGTTQRLYGITALDSSIAWAVGGAGHVLRTLDGGTTWDSLGSNVTDTLRAVLFLDNLNGWAVGDNGTIIHTGDAGASWTSDITGITSTLRDIGFTGVHLIAVGDNGTVLQRLWPPDTLLFGDVDLDLAITASDAVLILQHMVRKTTLTGDSLTAADVTNNGTISALDAARILQWVVGSITTFSAGDTFLVKLAAIPDPVPALGSGPLANDIITITLSLSQVQAVYAAEATFMFDANVYDFIGHGLSDLSAEFQAVSGNEERGIVRLSMAGVAPVKSDGALVHLRFRRISENPDAVGNLRLTSLVLNDAAVLQGALYAAASGLPTTYDLSHNYPNPFNPTTTIRYQVPEDVRVTLTVYNLLGQIVTTLVDEHTPAGFYRALWNGRNTAGRQVASGVYIFRMTAGEFVQTRKMLLLK